MRITQLFGPFEKNVTYTCPMPAGRYRYIHIGLQVPQTIPMTEVQLNEMNKFILSLDGKDFKINANDILEFVDLSETTNIKITPLQDMDRYTIIDLAYAAIED